MASTPVPFKIQPSYKWAGNDGNWSTFQVIVGNPHQSFDVFPSTCDSDVWVPITGACSPYSWSGCAASRGILSEGGAQAQGFSSNASTSWDQLGIFDLSLEFDLFGDDDSGLYGLDTVSLGTSDSTISITAQTVAAFATDDSWIGGLGLGVQPSRFDVQRQNLSTLLVSMKNANVAPSQSYGFAAGASYRSAAGGLVIGGYDVDAFTPSNLSFPLYFDLSRSLTVSLRGIVASNTPAGTVSLTTTTLNMSVDSTVSQIWLPQAVCDAFAKNLSLTYDSSIELYLINSTVRDKLRADAPQFVFTLAENATTGQTMNIVLPYAAFDQEVGLPTYNSSTPYFPIRRGANETQFVLGRTFLQEAYIVVDWERQNFTLGQSLHTSGVSTNIMPILPPSNGQSTPSAGAIAGIVIGAVALVTLTCIGGWIWWRKRHPKAIPPQALDSEKKHADVAKDGAAELPSPPPALRPELMSEERHELHEDQIKYQLMSNAVYELAGETPELASGEEQRAG